MSGSVQVKRMTPLRMDTGLTPGRRKNIDVSVINCVMKNNDNNN